MIVPTLQRGNPARDAPASRFMQKQASGSISLKPGGSTAQSGDIPMARDSVALPPGYGRKLVTHFFPLAARPIPPVFSFFISPSSPRSVAAQGFLGFIRPGLNDNVWSFLTLYINNLCEKVLVLQVLCLLEKLTERGCKDRLRNAGRDCGAGPGARRDAA